MSELNGYTVPERAIPATVASEKLSILRKAARLLAEARINRRDRHTADGIHEEMFCMECRLIQLEKDQPAHHDWCKTGKVMAALDALEIAERIEVPNGPGVGGFTPLAVSEGGAR